MFKKITVAIAVVCLAVGCMSAVSPMIKLSSDIPAVKKVIPAVPQMSSSENKTDTFAARFLNMLNHNFVYGEDFEDLKTIVNNSSAALLDRMDADGYINASYFENYLKNMYDITVSDIDRMNSDFAYKEGFVYVIPKGYTKYSHKLLSVNENEDGSYTVLTKVNVDRHDDNSETLTAVTVFIKNSESMFGYNIVSSELITNLCDA